MVKPIFDELASTTAEAPFHGRHLRRRHAPQPADRRPRSGSRARPARSRRCSSASARTARSEPTRPRSRSSARAPTCSPRATSSTTRRSRGRSRCRTCVSGRSRSARPISIEGADFVACHQFGLLGRIKVLESAKHGRDVPAQRPYGPDEVWDHLPGEVQRSSSTSSIDFWVIDALAVAARPGWAAAINTVMQPCFFQLAGVLPPEEAIAQHQGLRREDLRPSAARPIVERNFAAIDRSLERARARHAAVESPTSRRRSTPVPDDAPDFVDAVTARLMAGDGDLLPVSALPVDGTFPTGTARYEKRAIAQKIPIWDPTICIDCGKCAMVCPHATIRMKVFTDDRARRRARPASSTRSSDRSDLAGPPTHDPGRARRLHRLRRVRRRVPGQEQDRRRATRRSTWSPSPTTATSSGARWDFFQSIPRLDRDAAAARHGQGLAGPRAAVRVLGRLRRLRRDAVHQARHPAVRRPDDRRQRDRLLVDLRRQPADDAVDRERRRTGTGLEQLAVRGQRRVRARHAPRARRPDRSGAPVARAPGPRDRRGPRARAPRRRAGHRGRDRRASARRVDRLRERARARSTVRPRPMPRTC